MPIETIGTMIEPQGRFSVGHLRKALPDPRNDQGFLEWMQRFVGLWSAEGQAYGIRRREDGWIQAYRITLPVQFVSTAWLLEHGLKQQEPAGPLGVRPVVVTEALAKYWLKPDANGRYPGSIHTSDGRRRIVEAVEQRMLQADRESIRRFWRSQWAAWPRKSLNPEDRDLARTLRQKYERETGCRLRTLTIPRGPTLDQRRSIAKALLLALAMVVALLILRSWEASRGSKDLDGLFDDTQPIDSLTVFGLVSVTRRWGGGKTTIIAHIACVGDNAPCQSPQTRYRVALVDDQDSVLVTARLVGADDSVRLNMPLAEYEEVRSTKVELAH